MIKKKKFDKANIVVRLCDPCYARFEVIALNAVLASFLKVGGVVDIVGEYFFQGEKVYFENVLNCGENFKK